jgi:hypothetical protein
MVTITIESFSKQHSEEVGKCFLEMPLLPYFIKINGPFFREVVGKGVEAITIYEYDKSKEKEAQKFMNKREATFECVEGFKCSSNAWLEPRDAFEMMLSRTSVKTSRHHRELHI